MKFKVSGVPDTTSGLSKRLLQRQAHYMTVSDKTKLSYAEAKRLSSRFGSAPHALWISTCPELLPGISIAVLPLRNAGICPSTLVGGYARVEALGCSADRHSEPFGEILQQHHAGTFAKAPNSCGRRLDDGPSAAWRRKPLRPELATRCISSGSSEDRRAVFGPMP